MFAQYLRIVFIILALIGGVLLFAFAFTTAAIVVGILLLVGLIFGRPKGANIWVFRRGGASPWPGQEQARSEFPPRGPVTIDHDPNDLPPNESPPKT